MDISELKAKIEGISIVIRTELAAQNTSVRTQTWARSVQHSHAERFTAMTVLGAQGTTGCRGTERAGHTRCTARWRNVCVGVWEDGLR